MQKLDWEFIESRSGGYQRASYRGLVIEALQDCDASNPFESWDCEPPTLVYSGGRNGSRSDYSDGACETALDSIPDGKFRRHWRAIAEALDLKPEELHAEAIEEQKDYGGALTDIKRELAERALEELKPSAYSGNASDYLEALAALWRIAGREAVTWASSGYSQGDYASGLSVATPEWEEKTGAPRSSHKSQLEYAGKLWGYWAWGAVYGYVIKGPDGADLTDSARIGDSVWGFYGSDHGESGLEEQACDMADSIVDGARKARLDRLRSLITNRVPLHRRAFVLASTAPDLAPLFGKESAHVIA